MKRSHGFYSKHSRKLKAEKRSGLTKKLIVFPVGSTVWIKANPREKGGIPLRFNGRTAKIIARQGKGYVIEFGDLNATKRLTLAAGHLRETTTPPAHTQKS
ncbi:MAG: hypothetical protein Q8R15_04055 [Candidatus Micrarchaeota archaeon]|nr:hypothetical protein [Candidatus Micrarchaeota archaeon]